MVITIREKVWIAVSRNNKKKNKKRNKKRFTCQSDILYRI